MDRALAFYRDLLGASVTYQFPTDGDAVYAGLELGRSHLGIGLADPPDQTVNDRVTLWVYAADCDAAIDQLRSAGVAVVAEPADQPWGERIARVVDPDGNPVIIAQRPTDSG
jgi:lactoylglutathione lyase